MAKAKKVYVPIPENCVEPFTRMVPADRLKYYAEKRKEAEAAILYDELIKIFAAAVLKNHNKPANPNYAYYDESGRLDQTAIFQVQNKFKINLSERQGADDMSLEARFLADFTDAGLTAEVAQKLIDGELHIYASLDIKPLDELIYGKYVEGEWVESTPIMKAAGEKIRRNLIANEGDDLFYLTQEERDESYEEIEKVKVKPGFWARVYQYVTTVDQLVAVLRILDPTHFCSHMHYGVSDDPAKRNSRLGDEGVKLMGIAPRK
jgi:hypothetical protein